MSRAPQKDIELTARLEILNEADDDNPVRKTIELTPEQRAAAEREKQQLLVGIARGVDDSPRARRLGKGRPEGMVDPDAPVVSTEDELRARAKANLGITLGRAPEPVDLGDPDDVREERRQLDLSPDEIAALESERSQLVAQIRSSRPTTDVADEPPVVGGDIDIPSSPELEAAAAAVAEVDSEIAAFEAERKAVEKKRIEDQKSEELAHQERLAEFKAKRDAADLVRTQAIQKQASVELRLRAEKSRQAAARELERRARVQSDLNEQLRERIQPPLDGCRAELAELEQFAQDNEETLANLWRQNWKSCPATWPMDLRLEFQRHVSGNAYRIYMELKRSLDAYPRHIKTLEDIIRDGDVIVQVGDAEVKGRTGFIEQSLYEVSISRPGIGDGIAASLRRDLARLNEIAADVYDRGAFAESQGVVHVVEEPAISKDHQEQTKQQLLRGDEPVQQTRAIAHPGEESTASIEAYLQRVDGAVRQA